MKTTKNDSTAEWEKEFRTGIEKAYELAASFDDASDFECAVRYAIDFIVKALQRQREEIVRSFRDEVIGEDETTQLISNNRVLAESQLFKDRNTLRAEQRQKLDKLLK